MNHSPLNGKRHKIENGILIQDENGLLFIESDVKSAVAGLKDELRKDYIDTLKYNNLINQGYRSGILHAIHMVDKWFKDLIE